MGLFSSKKKAPEPPVEPKPLVLVCSKNEQTIADLVQVLKQKDFWIAEIVQFANNVIPMWKVYQPEIVLLDNELYGRNGLDMLCELHETYPEAVTIYIDTFFESTAKEKVVKALQYGAKHLLAKNVQGEIPAKNISAGLEAAMEAVLQKKASES